MKIYGQLDCSSAKRAVAAGNTYQKHRVSSPMKPPLSLLDIERAEHLPKYAHKADATRRQDSFSGGHRRPG
jgi:hypothetical protein